MDNREHVDVLIVHGCVMTIDPARRVIDDGAVAVKGDRIVALGKSAELCAKYSAERIINARRKAVLPDFIDAHAHAGHAMLRTIGGPDGDAWTDACESKPTMPATSVLRIFDIRRNKLLGRIACHFGGIAEVIWPLACSPEFRNRL